MCHCNDYTGCDSCGGCCLGTLERPQEARRGDERREVDLSQDSEYRRLTEGLRLAQQELDEARIEQFKADKEVTERTRSRYRWKEELDKHVQSLTK